MSIDNTYVKALSWVECDISQGLSEDRVTGQESGGDVREMWRVRVSALRQIVSYPKICSIHSAFVCIIGYSKTTSFMYILLSSGIKFLQLPQRKRETETDRYTQRY